tara:strand:+ start:5545 stop:6057 length:513 start_codon:yes stop_codon:yes gene_type:complete
MTPQKILVTGNAGSGKSTFATKLGEKTGLPVFGLDNIVWRSGWVKTPRDEINAQIQDLIAQPAWIIDGVSSLVERTADTVVFLDISSVRCTWNCAKRNWRYFFRSRPGLPDNCPEILIVPQLLKIIWRFNANVRPDILERMARAHAVQTYYRGRNSMELAKITDSLTMVS